MSEADAGFGELRSGNLGVRLALDGAEVDAVQALRYRVFYEEMGAHPDAATAGTRRDRDDFDAVADHLLVVDHDRGEGADSVVGTYRLIRRPAAAKLGRWYSAAEYDISRLVAFDGEVLELGRSCVDAAYRTRGTLQLLWGGIAAYVFKHRIALMFGCASLPGTDLDALADQLTYLAANHMAPEAIRPRALPDRYIEMRRKDPAAIDVVGVEHELDTELRGLPFGGYVDLISEVDVGRRVTDYKTGAPKPRYWWGYWRQQYLYAAALGDVAEVELLYLTRPRSVRRPVYPAAMARALAELEQAHEERAAMAEASAYEARPGPLCSWCDFRVACPAQRKDAPAPGSAASDERLESAGLTRR